MTPTNIAGTWELITWRQPDGEPEYPFGTNPVGYLTFYPESGYVALQAMKAGRPNVSVLNDNYLWMSITDKAASAEGFFGYAGQYTCQGDTITHTPDIAFNPNLIGQPQAYKCHLSGDTLTLSDPKGNLETTWQRAKSVESSDTRLVGIWKMVSMAVTFDGFLSRLLRIMTDWDTPFFDKLIDEPIIYPHGRQASGFIMYNQHGYMSAHVMNANRPRLTTADDLLRASVQEKAQATHTYLSYAGPYQVQGDQVIHQPNLSLFQNYVGTDLVRIIKLADPQLILSTVPVHVLGVTVDIIIGWERVA